MVFIIHGNTIRKTTKVTTIRGTNASAVSCMDVMICRMLMTRPTINPAPSMGALTNSTVSSVCLARRRTVSSGIAFDQRGDDQVPAIDHDEQQNFEWQ